MSVLVFIISVVLFACSLLIANLLNAKKCKRDTRYKLIWCMINCVCLGLSVLYSFNFLHYFLLIGWAFYIAYELYKVMGDCKLRLCHLINSETCKARN